MVAEQDGHLRQKLQHVLKLSKEKWDEARDHALRAVTPDNCMRQWWVDPRTMEVRRQGWSLMTRVVSYNPRWHRIF